jgi:hypothetical protein
MSVMRQKEASAQCPEADVSRPALAGTFDPSPRGGGQLRAPSTAS